MAGKTLIGGTAYTIKGGKTKVNGTAYSITKGITKVGGTAKTISFSRLPSGFQEVEYIQSSGTQWIDTNLKYLKFSFDTKVVPLVVSSEQGLFGSNGSGTYPNNAFRLYEGYFNYYFGNKVFKVSIYASVGVEYIISATMNTGSQSLTVNGTTATASHTAQITTNNMLIFAFNSNGSYVKGNWKVFYFKLYDGDGTLTRDYVPCYCTTATTGYKGSTAVSVSSGTIGLYDLANNRFYVNSGSGTFTKGADV